MTKSKNYKKITISLLSCFCIFSIALTATQLDAKSIKISSSYYRNNSYSQKPITSNYPKVVIVKNSKQQNTNNRFSYNRSVSSGNIYKHKSFTVVKPKSQKQYYSGNKSYTPILSSSKPKSTPPEQQRGDARTQYRYARDKAHADYNKAVAEAKIIRDEALDKNLERFSKNIANVWDSDLFGSAFRRAMDEARDIHKREKDKIFATYKKDEAYELAKRNRTIERARAIYENRTTKNTTTKQQQRGDARTQYRYARDKAHADYNKAVAEAKIIRDEALDKNLERFSKNIANVWDSDLFGSAFRRAMDEARDIHKREKDKIFATYKKDEAYELAKRNRTIERARAIYENRTTKNTTTKQQQRGDARTQYRYARDKAHADYNKAVAEAKIIRDEALDKNLERFSKNIANVWDSDLFGSAFRRAMDEARDIHKREKDKIFATYKKDEAYELAKRNRTIERARAIYDGART